MFVRALNDGHSCGHELSLISHSVMGGIVFYAFDTIEIDFLLYDV